jgi:GT2 family glycosyltransferase
MPGSTDGSPKVLEGLKDARIQVVTRGRLGVASALNAGFSLAGGDDVVRLHADVVIETPSWPGRLAAAAYTQPKAGVVRARLVYPDGRIQSEGRTIISGVGFHAMHRDNRAFQPDGPPGPICEVDSVSGALAYYRRDALADTGGLDENNGPAWMEDDDFCVAARHRNYKVYDCSVGSRQRLEDRGAPGGEVQR